MEGYPWKPPLVCHILPLNIQWVFKNIIIKTVIICIDNRTLKKDLLITLLVYYIKCTNLYYNKNALLCKYYFFLNTMIQPICIQLMVEVFFSNTDQLHLSL